METVHYSTEKLNLRRQTYALSVLSFLIGDGNFDYEELPADV